MSKRNKVGDEMLRKKTARLRFKRLLRMVVANVLWIGDTDQAGITMNVKKNVAMLVRKKHKTGILTNDVGIPFVPHLLYLLYLAFALSSSSYLCDLYLICAQQKAMLVAPHHRRTIEERRKLCMIIAGLGCFNQIPPVREHI